MKLSTAVRIAAFPVKVIGTAIVAVPLAILLAWIEVVFNSELPDDEDYDGDPSDYYVSHKT